MFDPVGQPAGASRAAFQFTGQRAADGTGLLYFGARYYDPELGMFITHDPALQFFSPYSYGNGNPLNGTDPTGEDWEYSSESDSYDPYDSSSYSDRYDDELHDPHALLSDLAAISAQAALIAASSHGILDPVGAEAPEEEEAWEEFQRQRPDLGVVGNAIRSGLDSTIEQELFENYWLGGGDVRLTDERFRSIVDYTPSRNPLSTQIVTGPVGEWLLKRTYDFSGSREYDRALGTASIFYNRGQPVGFYDRYNFDPKPWDTRPLPAEVITRGVNFLGSQYGAQPFDIIYGTYVRP